MQLKTQRSGSKNWVWLCYYFIFGRNYDVLKSKSTCILLNKNTNFNKKKQNRKWEIPHTALERRTVYFCLYKNRKLKVKLWWAGARESKKRAFFVPFILSEGNFFNICFNSVYSVLNTLSEFTYFYISKNINSYTFSLFLKSSNTFSVSIIYPLMVLSDNVFLSKITSKS